MQNTINDEHDDVLLPWPGTNCICFKEKMTMDASDSVLPSHHDAVGECNSGTHCTALPFCSWMCCGSLRMFTKLTFSHSMTASNQSQRSTPFCSCCLLNNAQLIFPHVTMPPTQATPTPMTTMDNNSSAGANLKHLHLEQLVIEKQRWIGSNLPATRRLRTTWWPHKINSKGCKSAAKITECCLWTVPSLCKIGPILLIE